MLCYCFCSQHIFSKVILFTHWTSRSKVETHTSEIGEELFIKNFILWRTIDRYPYRLQRGDKFSVSAHAFHFFFSIYFALILMVIVGAVVFRLLRYVYKSIYVYIHKKRNVYCDDMASAHFGIWGALRCFCGQARKIVCI